MSQRKILSLSNLSLSESKTIYLFAKNYFRKKKINCYEIMPGGFHVIYGSMVGENRRLSTSTETPGKID